MQEEDYIDQEQVSQQIHVEENSNSNDDTSSTPNASNNPNNEPPPITNDLGEPVVINSSTIRVGTDYFKPSSEKEVDTLVTDSRINVQQKKLFQLQYEANYGPLPKEPAIEEEVVKEEQEENDQIIPRSILPQTSASTDKETEPVDKIINLKELAGDHYSQNTNPTTEGPSPNIPVPTEVAPVQEAPLIDVAQLMWPN